MKESEIQVNIEECLKRLGNRQVPHEYRANLIAELQAYVALRQLKHNQALVFWTKVLAAVTFVYAAVAAIDIYFSHLAK